MLTTYIVPLLIYWLVLYVTCYITVDFSQKYLYDEATPALGWKILLGSGIFAAILTYTRTRFDTMLTGDVVATVLQAIVWFAVFALIFRFNGLHAFAIGVVAFVFLAGLSSLAVDSFTNSTPTGVPADREPSKPIRRTLASPFSSAEPKKAEPKKAEPAPGATKPAEATAPGASK